MLNIIKKKKIILWKEKNWNEECGRAREVRLEREQKNVSNRVRLRRKRENEKIKIKIKLKIK